MAMMRRFSWLELQPSTVLLLLLLFFFPVHRRCRSTKRNVSKKCEYRDFCIFRMTNVDIVSEIKLAHMFLLFISNSVPLRWNQVLQCKVLTQIVRAVEDNETRDKGLQMGRATYQALWYIETMTRGRLLTSDHCMADISWSCDWSILYSYLIDTLLWLGWLGNWISRMMLVM